METNDQISRDLYEQLAEYDGTTNSDNNMTTIGKVDTSDLMMMIRWITNVSSRSPRPEWITWTNTAPYPAKEIYMVIEKTVYMFNTPSTEYTQKAFTDSSRFSPYAFNALKHICMLMIMRGNGMFWCPGTSLIVANHPFVGNLYSIRLRFYTLNVSSNDMEIWSFFVVVLREVLPEICDTHVTLQYCIGLDHEFIVCLWFIVPVDYTLLDKSL